MLPLHYEATELEELNRIAVFRKSPRWIGNLRSCFRRAKPDLGAFTGGFHEQRLPACRDLRTGPLIMSSIIRSSCSGS